MFFRRFHIHIVVMRARLKSVYRLVEGVVSGVKTVNKQVLSV